MGSGLGRAAALSSILGVTQRFLQIAVTLLVTPAVIGALGTHSFGIWAAAASLTWIVGTIDLGVGSALVTDISRALAMDEKSYVRDRITAALWLGGGIALTEIFVFALVIPRFAPVDASDAYMVAAVIMAANVPLSFTVSLWAGAQRFYIVSIWEMVQTLLTGLVMWKLVSQTNDVRLYVAASAGGVFAANSASLAHFLMTHPDLRPLRTLPSPSVVLHLLRLGAPYLILSLAVFLASYSDNMIALSILGGDDAGVMAISQRVCMTALGLLLSLAQPLWPSLANAAVRKEMTWIRRNFFSAACVVVSAAIVGSGFLISFGGRLVDLWLGGKVVIGPEILWAMGIWIIFPALGRIPDILLNALGVVWFQVKVAVVYGILAFIFKLWLSHIWGVAGILASTGIAYALTHLPAYLWWVWRWMRHVEAS